MSVISIQTNGPFPNRIVLNCGPFTGPFSSAGPLGAFNPIRDLEIYIDGVLTPVKTWSFDTNGNRYLMYIQDQFDLQGVIQVACHMPNPPFKDSAGSPATIPGLALMGTYSSSGDQSITPAISLAAVPNPAVHDTSVDLLWASVNVQNVKITSPGLIGVEFGGSTGYTHTANYFTWNYNPNVSAEFWFQTTTTAGGFFVTACPNQLPPDASLLFGVFMNTAGKIGAGFYNGVSNQLSTLTPLAYNDGSLHHCAVTVNGAYLDIYIDGALILSTPVTSNVGSQNGWWRIANGPGAVGGGWPAISSYMHSFISHVSVWDTVVLTALQITTHYNAFINTGQAAYETAVAADSPTSFWHLTEVTGTTAFDAEMINGITTFDTEEPSTGTGTAVTTPLLTPAVSPEVALFFMVSAYGDFFTPDVGWSHFGNQPPGGGIGAAYYKILNSVTPISGSATGSISADWAASLFTFRLTGNSVTIVQQSGGSGGGPFGLAPTAPGNTLLVAVLIAPTVGSPSVSVSDTQFNIYQHIVHVTAGPTEPQLDIFITQGIPGGSLNVTIGGVSGQSSQYFAAYEIQANVGLNNGTYVSPVDLILNDSLGGLNSGFLSTVGNGVYVVPSGFTSTTTLTIGAYDALFNPIIVSAVPLKAQTILTIT
jgi:hypothetical protein